jgi:PAS domain S-box-containing protein
LLHVSRINNSIRVLLVDDEESQLEIAKLALENVDPSIIITVTADPSQVYQLLQQPFDCVVSDYRMGEINGLQLCKDIKKKSNIPYILYTARGSEEVAEEAFNVGVDDYVRKEQTVAHYRLLARRIRHAVTRRRDEEELSRLASFPQFSPNPIVEADFSGKIDYFNPAARKEFPNLVKMGSMSSIALNWEEVITQLHDSGKALLIDVQIRGIWYSLSLNLVPGSNTVRLYATNIDERKRSEEATKARARASEETLRGFMDSAPDNFWIYSSDLKLIDINAKALEYMGATRENVIGKRLEELAPGIQKEERYSVFLRVMETGDAEYIDDFQSLPKFGKTWVNQWVFKVGNHLGIISRDVTNRKKLEEKLRVAEKFNIVNRIGATVAHDLRSPLSAINYAAFLGKKKPELSEKMFDNIIIGVDRCSRMIEEFRAGTQEVKVTKARVDLVPLIRESLNEVHLLESIKVNWDLPNMLTAEVDPEILRRVLDNLIRNAVDAMSGSGVLSISARRDAGELTIMVGDTGEGVKEENKKSLFEPLFTTKKTGLGLGLYYVRMAVEAHGGRIDFTSMLGQGTTFKIVIPIQ